MQNHWGVFKPIKVYDLGSGVNTLKKTPAGSLLKHGEVAPSVITKQTIYESGVVDSHESQSHEISVHGNVTVESPPAVVSLEGAYSKNTFHEESSLFGFISWRYCRHSKSFGINQPAALVSAANNDPQLFYRNYGDQLVNRVYYGKRLDISIHFKSITSATKQTMMLAAQASLKQLGEVGAAGGKIDFNATEGSFSQFGKLDVTIQAIGIDCPPLMFFEDTNIHDVLKKISGFIPAGEKAGDNQAPPQHEELPPVCHELKSFEMEILGEGIFPEIANSVATTKTFLQDLDAEANKIEPSIIFKLIRILRLGKDSFLISDNDYTKCDALRKAQRKIKHDYQRIKNIILNSTAIISDCEAQLISELDQFSANVNKFIQLTRWLKSVEEIIAQPVVIGEGEIMSHNFRLPYDLSILPLDSYVGFYIDGYPYVTSEISFLVKKRDRFLKSATTQEPFGHSIGFKSPTSEISGETSGRLTHGSQIQTRFLNINRSGERETYFVIDEIRREGEREESRGFRIILTKSETQHLTIGSLRKDNPNAPQLENIDFDDITTPVGGAHKRGKSEKTATNLERLNNQTTAEFDLAHEDDGEEHIEEGAPLVAPGTAVTMAVHGQFSLSTKEQGGKDKEEQSKEVQSKDKPPVSKHTRSGASVPQ